MVHTNDFLPEKNSIGEREKMIIGQWVAAGVAQCLQHGVAQWRWWGVEQRPFLPETIPGCTINLAESSERRKSIPGPRTMVQNSR